MFKYCNDPSSGRSLFLTLAITHGLFHPAVTLQVELKLNSCSSIVRSVRLDRNRVTVRMIVPGVALRRNGKGRGGGATAPSLPPSPSTLRKCSASVPRRQSSVLTPNSSPLFACGKNQSMLWHSRTTKPPNRRAS